MDPNPQGSGIIVRIRFQVIDAEFLFFKYHKTLYTNISKLVSNLKRVPVPTFLQNIFYNFQFQKIIFRNLGLPEKPVPDPASIVPDQHHNKK